MKFNDSSVEFLLDAADTLEYGESRLQNLLRLLAYGYEPTEGDLDSLEPCKIEGDGLIAGKGPYRHEPFWVRVLHRAAQDNGLDIQFGGQGDLECEGDEWQSFLILSDDHRRRFGVGKEVHALSVTESFRGNVRGSEHTTEEFAERLAYHYTHVEPESTS